MKRKELLKLMNSVKESLRDYRRDVSKNWVNQMPRNVGILTQRIAAVLVTQNDGRQEGKGIDYFLKRTKEERRRYWRT